MIIDFDQFCMNCGHISELYFCINCQSLLGCQVCFDKGINKIILCKKCGKNAFEFEPFIEWSREVAIELARKDGLELTEKHWEVIYSIREYYKTYGQHPPRRVLMKIIGKKYGQEKGKPEYLYNLFPEARTDVVGRYAGLPRSKIISR